MRIIKYTLLLLASVVALCMHIYAFSSPEISGECAIRAQEPVGFRVKAVLSLEQAENENTTEYGFLVTRKVFLSGSGLSNNDLVLDCKAYYLKSLSKGIVDGETVDIFFEKNDSELFFTGYMYGILPRYYDEIIVVRPYAVNSGIAYYGVPVEFSLYAAAKQLKNSSAYYELSQSQQNVIDSVVVAVEGEPYIFDRKDCRIVIKTEVVKNFNPTYSVSYDLYNPFTGEILQNVIGRTKSKDRQKIEAMLLNKGTVVPVYDGIVQDAYEGYADVLISDNDLVWISECNKENGTMNVSAVDASLKCKKCVSEYVDADGAKTVKFDENTPVTVVSENVSMSSMNEVAGKDSSLLCYNTYEGSVLYSDYIKAYASIDESANCEYIIVVVNDNENSALDEVCLNHTEFDVKFYVDGNVCEYSKVLYGNSPSLPQAPEKEGYDFVGWSSFENGEIVSPEQLAVTDNTAYYAVFDKKTFEVLFYVNGEIYTRSHVQYGNTPGEPVKPTVSNAAFLGWSRLENGTMTDIVSLSELVITESTSFYAVLETRQNDPKLIEIMTRGRKQLKKIIITNKSKNDIARDLIVECMTYVLDDANAGIYIDKSYIYNTYSELAGKIKKAIKYDMTKEERSAFINILTNTRNIDKDVQDFLIEYFDIDMGSI